MPAKLMDAPVAENFTSLSVKDIKGGVEMPKIIRVNLARKALYSAPVPDRYSFLGGRGLTSRIIFDEVDPTCGA